MVDATRAQSVLFVPVDRRFPKVRVETRQLARLAGMRVVVAVDAWADDERYPRGHYVKTLGKRGDKAVETALILQELEVATAPFSTAVLACLPPEGEAFAITEEEVARRMDLRALDVCSIDPPGCRDIDDALHCVGPLANGNYQVGVHIADVTHFVASGSPLDLDPSDADLVPLGMSGDRFVLEPGTLTPGQTYTVMVSATVVDALFARARVPSVVVSGYGCICASRSV